jgi:hypothetical protein
VDSNDDVYHSELLQFLSFDRRSVFWKVEKTSLQTLDLFPSSGEWDVPTLGYLELANLNH